MSLKKKKVSFTMVHTSAYVFFKSQRQSPLYILTMACSAHMLINFSHLCELLNRASELFYSVGGGDLMKKPSD